MSSLASSAEQRPARPYTRTVTIPWAGPGAWLSVVVALVILLATFVGRGGVRLGPTTAVEIGLMLTGALLAGAGIFASSLTRNQVVAFIIAFLISFGLYLCGKTSTYLPLALARVADFMGLDSHLDALSRGVIDSRDLLYYATCTGLFLFLTQVRLTLARSD